MNFILALAALFCPSAHAASGSAQRAEIPKGFVLVEEDVSLNWHSLPLALMEESVVDFHSDYRGEAAGDLKAAARALRASRSTDPDMRAAADNLVLLSREIRGGTVNTLDGIRARLTQVAYYQSLGFRRQALKEWGAHQLKAAGYDLDASASALERSLAWSGKPLSSDTDASVRDGHAVAAKLVAGNGWKESDVTNALSELSTTAQALGAKILPEASRAAETPASL